MGMSPGTAVPCAPWGTQPPPAAPEVSPDTTRAFPHSFWGVQAPLHPSELSGCSRRCPVPSALRRACLTARTLHRAPAVPTHLGCHRLLEVPADLCQLPGLPWEPGGFSAALQEMPLP